MSKRKSSDAGTTAQKKRRTGGTPEEEEARRLREEIAMLQSQLKYLDQQATPAPTVTVTVKKAATTRAPPHNPTPAADLWDDDDYDEVDVGGSFTGPRPSSSRARRTPRPTNKYTSSLDQLADVDIPDGPIMPKRRSSKFTKKPVLPAPTWTRILPQSKIPVSQRGNKRQDPMTYCANIVKELWKHPLAWVFHKPVDPVALNIPDYFTIIHHPMDFSTVQKRLRTKAYATIKDFDEDMRLIWSNAMLYNAPGSDVYAMASQLSKIYEQKFQIALELDKGGAELKKQQLLKMQKTLQTEKEKLQKQFAALQAQRQAQRQAQEQKEKPTSDVVDMSPPLRSRSEMSSEPVSYGDRCQLCNAVNGLQDKYMPGVIKIFRDETPQLLKSSNATVEINTDALDTMTLRRLEAYLNDCKAKDQMLVNKAEGKEVPEQLLLESMQVEKKESTSSSSSSGSSSSSDSSDSDSDSEDGGVKPVLIMPSILPQPQPTLQAQKQPPPPSSATTASASASLGQPGGPFSLQNIDAWSMLNTSGGGTAFSPSSPGLGGATSPVKEEEAKPQLDNVWNDFKNAQAAQAQRERELRAIEEVKQQQLRQKQEEEVREAQLAKIKEEERQRQEKLLQEQQFEQQREAERLRRQQETGTVNLMDQNEFMAAWEKQLF